ncbi:MAG: hypothetical protein QXU74_02475 [Candidatus Aenigmatarchaeota archaeon]
MEVIKIRLEKEIKEEMKRLRIKSEEELLRMLSNMSKDDASLFLIFGVERERKG